MADGFHFGSSPITCHSWNADRSMLALSLNNNTVNIYKRVGSEWNLMDSLKGHDLLVTGIDWAPQSNRIVTCSADRNAYVWTRHSDNKWRQTLVLLRINRAATCVKWSPKENKFAVGSGARLISICYFEKENNWWVSKHIKKPIRSTITCIDWHPNNVLLAAGSTDFKVRIFSAYIKEIEDKPSATSWGTKMPFAYPLCEFNNSAVGGGGWVHSVKFSHKGERVCWVGHDSSISVVDASQDMTTIQLLIDDLPYTVVIWVAENYVVAAGHGCVPMLYSVNGGKIAFQAKIENNKKQKSASINAMDIFKNLDRTAKRDQDQTLTSMHQNTITGIAIHSASNDGKASIVSTCGADSQVVLWNFKTLEDSIKALHLA